MKSIKISYESRETWRPGTDRLRATPDRYGSPRYDWVLFKGSAQGEYHYGQLNSVFTCTIDGVMFPLALITVYDFVYGPRSRVGHDLGLVRIRAIENEYGGSVFIHLSSIIRGALVVPDFEFPVFDYRLVIHLVDSDMFLRLQEHLNPDT